MRLLSWKWSCSVLSIALAAGLPLGSEALAQTAMTLARGDRAGRDLGGEAGHAAESGACAADVRPEPSQQPSSDDVGGVPLDKIGSAVTVVTGEQLRAQQIRHAGDALRSLPGVAVSRSGGYGSKTQVRIRGAEGNHTLVLIDGIEANGTSDGEFDFSDLSAEDIERIEVIRGPQSGLYGSNAIGGVINVITKGGKGPLTASVRIEGGALRHERRCGPRIRRQRQGVVRCHRPGASLAVLQHRQDRFGGGPGAPDHPGAQGWCHRHAGHGAGLQPAQRQQVCAHRHRWRASRRWPSPGGSRDAPDTADTNLFLGGVKLTWDTLGGAYTHVFRANRSTFDQKTQTWRSGLRRQSERDSTNSAISAPIGSPRRVFCRPSIR